MQNTDVDRILNKSITISCKIYSCAYFFLYFFSLLTCNLLRIQLKFCPMNCEAASATNAVKVNITFKGYGQVHLQARLQTYFTFLLIKRRLFGNQNVSFLELQSKLPLICNSSFFWVLMLSCFNFNANWWLKDLQNKFCKG